MLPSIGEASSILILAMLKRTQTHLNSLKNPPLFSGGFFVCRRIATYVLLSLLIPMVAHAQIFSEIMYDNVGADTNEWIEIYNNTAETLDIKDFKLAEGNSNHNLKLVNGQTSLSKDSYAVIANDAVLFMSKHPSFSGTLFDSTFTLSNQGETLQLKDSKGNPKDTITYVSSKGAQGDGNSLQLIDTVFIASLPTPGMRNIVNNPKLALTSAAVKKVTKVPEKGSGAVVEKTNLSQKEAQVASVQSVVESSNQTFEEKKVGAESNVFVVKKQESVWLKLKKFFTKLF